MQAYFPQDAEPLLRHMAPKAVRQPQLPIDTAGVESSSGCPGLGNAAGAGSGGSMLPQLMAADAALQAAKQAAATAAAAAALASPLISAAVDVPAASSSEEPLPQPPGMSLLQPGEQHAEAAPGSTACQAQGPWLSDIMPGEQLNFWAMCTLHGYLVLATESSGS